MADPLPSLPVPRAEASGPRRSLPTSELVLLGVLALECAVFSLSGTHFLGRANAFEVARLGVEVGLLALAMTAVIVTGGIDLSVGSMMGLAAVVLGALWRDAHWPIAAAVLAALLAGAAGGALNAVVFAPLGFPSPIVTLGTFPPFPGIAEGPTSGSENYSGLPPPFLFWAQGYRPA